MAKEIERKFLVCASDYALMAERILNITQFYLSAAPERTVRVRYTDTQGWITVKGITHGFTRSEWEYAIPHVDAVAMEACHEGRVVSKTRYVIPAEPAGLYWEVDVFHGALEGLMVAEIELPAEEASFTRPAFLRREVTGDPRYYNSALALSSEVPPCD